MPEASLCPGPMFCCTYHAVCDVQTLQQALPLAERLWVHDSSVDAVALRLCAGMEPIAAKWLMFHSRQWAVVARPAARERYCSTLYAGVGF